MKLTSNENFILRLLVDDPLMSNQDIAKKLKITSQGVGKIKKQLYEKDIIRNHELGLDYEKLDINIHAIDFKEFQKPKNGELLYTEGVATCTALTISYPGKFGYLIHITPTDEVYRDIGFLTKIFFKNRCTDFVGTVMNSINRYDIIQYEKSLLRFGIFATHNSSFKDIIHKLIDNGVELSQIKILFKKNSNKVDIIFDYREDQVWSLWKGNGFNMTFADEYKHIPDFGEIVMSMI